MKNILLTTDFHFPRQTAFYKGKVRDVYTIENNIIIMVATDRISAFDVVLPQGIPAKGQILNQIAAYFLDATQNICPNWKINCPDPMVSIGRRCIGFPVEMIVRGYLCGSAWRAYKKGARTLCGIKIPDGMQENQPFEQPIITPTTKAEQGMHDEDISKEEILAKGLVSEENYALLEQYSLALFQKGTEIAAKMGLILVDTKYEFGTYNGNVLLMDEVHTPDSSRYFYSADYQQRFHSGEQPRQLSKEFVRQWLLQRGFNGQKGQPIPQLTPEVAANISARYAELYQQLIGKPFIYEECPNLEERIFNNVVNFLQTSML
jgi:phosphoribosylaminoimidazole-succinocarboxamide synthase